MATLAALSTAQKSKAWKEFQDSLESEAVRYTAALLKFFSRKKAPQKADLGLLLKTMDSAAHAAATSPTNLRSPPTSAQRRAGNYKKGHIKIAGIPIAIENPEFSHRKPEYPAMIAHYGYVKGTKGADGDEVDVFVKPGTLPNWSGKAYVVDQEKANGSFDEHKILLGYDTLADAKRSYFAHFTAGWKIKAITELSLGELKDWLFNGDKSKPLATSRKEK